jgi:hypothetical protein
MADTWAKELSTRPLFRAAHQCGPATGLAEKASAHVLRKAGRLRRAWISSRGYRGNAHLAGALVRALQGEG